MSLTQDNKTIINVIVNDDVPNSDFAEIWRVAAENKEPCLETQLCNIVELSKLLTEHNSELFLMVYGGQKTFEAIQIYNNIRNVQWMPHSGC